MAAPLIGARSSTCPEERGSCWEDTSLDRRSMKGLVAKCCGIEMAVLVG